MAAGAVRPCAENGYITLNGKFAVANRRHCRVKEVVGGKAGSKARPSVTLGGFAGLLCLILARQRWQN